MGMDAPAMKRHQYTVTLRVDHSSREECLAELKKLFLRLEADEWPSEGFVRSGQAPKPRVEYSHGPIMPTMEDRLSALEAEFDLRLGGISEENAA
jgi:hypothetical protein